MKPTGGRGKKAPYETTHVRIPVALKLVVEVAIAEYRDLVLNGIISVDEPVSEQIIQFSNSSVPDLEKAKAIAHSILKGKKSARQSLEKLLTALYGEDVTL